MTSVQLEAKLQELCSLSGEVEWVEFKRAETSFDTEEIGEYFSALSNEANLKRQPYGWLIFGIEDRSHVILGTRYRMHRPKLDDLKREVANHTTGRLTFEEIYEIATPSGRVILFQIPAALRGMPTAWKGHFYGRDGESKVGLSVHEIEHLRAQSVQSDWSAVVCSEATLDDLDPAALSFARQRFKEKHQSLIGEVNTWDDKTFLHKVKVISNEQITRAGLILLGREESIRFLTPAVAQVTWILKDHEGTELDYAHFYPPFILKVEQVYKKIRNLTLRVLSGDTLFPKEIAKYDDWVFREALHNCIAHQDYMQNGRIHLIEQDDSLLFVNSGSFLPGTVENVIVRDVPEESYRNDCLARVMVSLNMIDTIGSGIKRMFRKQKERFLPMPDYDLTDPSRVKVRIFGKFLDERFTHLLMARTDLSLIDVILLDQVQKRKPISDDAYRKLKKDKLIEGRKSAPYISADVALATEREAEYIRNRGIDRDDCKRKILDYLKQFETAPRRKFVELLAPLLSDALSQRQKADFVKNLLQEMRREGTIQIIGGTKQANWKLSSSPSDRPN